MPGLTLEHKANSGFAFTIVVLTLSIAQKKPSLERNRQGSLSLERLLFVVFNVTVYTNRESLHLCQECLA